MKGKLLAWFLLMIISSSLSLTSNTSFKLGHVQSAANLTRPSIQQEHEITHGGVGTVEVNGAEDGDGSNKEKELKEVSIVSEKGQRGKAGVGGANVAHRPPQDKKNRATPTRHPCPIAKTMLHLTFTLALTLFFKLL